MKNGPSSDHYDAIIIGAGIGGLVCGCYLAKAGMKVLICEQHHKPGGYCTSFRRGRFTFDAAADCFGAYRSDGITRKVFEDLEIAAKINILRFDPSLVIMTPDYRLAFWSDIDRTTRGFQSAFPKERNNILKFFSFFLQSDAPAFARIRNWSFKQLLDSFFTDEQLKACLSMPLLAMAGLPPSLMSAFIGGKLFADFMLDGGYYPVNCMQVLADTLGARFKDLGGKLHLGTAVKKIVVRNQHVLGIVVDDASFISSQLVVSNGDARTTFLKLLGRQHLEPAFYRRIVNLIPSISNFVAYLGLDDDFAPSTHPGAAIFYFEHYDLDRAYAAAQEADFENYGGYSFRLSRNKSTLNALVPMAFKSRTYWNNQKIELLESLINRIEATTIPNLSKHIVYRDAASPQTLFEYTSNYRGASFGWATTPSQLALPHLRRPSFISGLYLTGHWTTLGLGIPGVIYNGFDTSRLILGRELRRS